MATGAGADKVGPTVADVAASVTPPVTPHERLDLLFQPIYQPERVMAHHWRAGDLVIWDNQAVPHGRPFVQRDGAARILRKIHAPSKWLRQLAQPTHAEAM